MLRGMTCCSMVSVCLGVEDENLATRRDTIRLHIHNLMEDMYREEEVLKAKLIDSVAHCTKELAELCNQLSLPFEGVITLVFCLVFPV